ncbi:MAG TPA: polysaccharide deacetylase family protein [Candidatus Binataceae bacterium]|nr:polysaccharide deacetylase family protein [Candidatus Binataceae bacterium]
MPPARRLNRIIKLLAAGLYWCALELRDAGLRCLGRRPPARVTVIYYHQVKADERARFAWQMEHLRHWCKPIPAGHTGPLASGRWVAVTADDGWLSFAQNALPEALSRAIPVTIFVIAGHLGDSAPPVPDCEGDRLLSGAEVAALSGPMVTIGCHTLSHRLIPGLSHAEAWRELALARPPLEACSGAPVDLFAFPFGECDGPSLELCRQAGYRRAFSGLPQAAMREPAEFLSGRVRVDPDNWRLEFHLKAVGGYAWVGRAIQLRRRLRARLAKPPISP